ncbi:glycosyltransferase family 2 protein [Agrobacterium sp.]|uniref:glycosyltransferase family 2 protein n=1 Tax=Agrobacterium sp. TaxID=361 RepID=UPI0028A7605C|nr:glycosyltransferase family 2 protein [Agrobacterium sp.]
MSTTQFDTPALTPKATRRTHAKVSDTLFDRVFTGWNRIAYLLGIAGWLVTLVYFWGWWLDTDHMLSMPYFIAVSISVFYVTILPAYFVLIFLNAKVVKQDAPLPQGRVAMVVTKAPSEPFSVVRKTMLAMLEQKIPIDYDVWLADEDPSAETRRWCGEHGVLISTRKGVEAYHRPKWPRRTRCKEGNLAYFYDHYGYDRYDFVAQFDADHVPENTYLYEILKPFADPAVGYVSAPSICDANADESWAARGRLYVEAGLHGAFQTGYNNGWAPLCIGSHYAVRTQALREVGGLGPELAEDHSTTLLMNAGGWRGVHALNAIAHGDGPSTFTDLAVQEFQWSRSLVTILLQYSKDYVPALPAKLKFQFLFSQIWYPLFSLVMAMMFAMPVIALMAGHPLVNVSYPEFMLHFLPSILMLTVFTFFWRATGTFRPHDARPFCWETFAFLFLRWPWSLAGCLIAVRDRITGSFVDFRITPKGGAKVGSLPIRIMAPYIALAAFTALVMYLAPDSRSTQGFYIFAAMNVTVYAFLVLLLMFRHASENSLSIFPRTWGNALATVSSVAIIAGGVVQLNTHGLGGLEALSHGQPYVSFTETRFNASGAGVGGTKTIKMKFRVKWHGVQPELDVQVKPGPAQPNYGIIMQATTGHDGTLLKGRLS